MKQKRINIKLDDETHRRLKVAAFSSEQRTIQAFIVHLIKQAVYQIQKS